MALYKGETLIADGGSSGNTTKVDTYYSSGNKIATISVDNEIKDIYVPNDCVSYVISTDHKVEDDGSTWWYKVYSDGFCEQGGYANQADSSTDYPITFPKPLNTILSINGTSIGNQTSGGVKPTYISLELSKSDGKVIGAIAYTWNPATGTENHVPVCWRAEGYI